MPSEFSESPIIIFENENKQVEVKIDYTKDTIWLSQDQIALLFDKERSVITKHINNIFKEEELEENRVCALFARTATDGKTYQTQFYNLDLILSVGYRTNSKRATKFRQWASTILKDYLIQGYSLNQKLLTQKQAQIIEIQQTLDFLIKNGKNLENQELFLDILQKYSHSLIILNQFDENRLELKDKAKSVKIEVAEYLKIIEQTKTALIDKKEATQLFGQQYEGKFAGIIGNINLTFDGQELYTTLEQKAAHLLYFIIKDHTFVDGNKRIGSILFIYNLAKNNFLHKANGEPKINENTLVALALLIAQSKPEDKEIMIKLVVKLIQEE